MDAKANRALFAAILKLLRPLIRILLRNSVPFRIFTDLAKWIYVDVALKEYGIAGRKQSDSRVSIITGLSRKEVRRLKKVEQPTDEDAVVRYNRAARVISGWLKDRRFVDDKGQPRPLYFDEGENSFSDLVKTFSGDVPPRAILDELINVEAVKKLKDAKIQLLTRAYLPIGDEPGALSILGTDVAYLIRTIDHNIITRLDKRFFQRKVSYDNLPEEAIPAFRRLSAKRCQKLLERLDRWLSEHDRDLKPSIGGKGRMQAGIGIYYFEEDLSKDQPEEDHKGTEQ
jgi:hypothetical protein